MRNKKFGYALITVVGLIIAGCNLSDWWKEELAKGKRRDDARTRKLVDLTILLVSHNTRGLMEDHDRALFDFLHHELAQVKGPIPENMRHDYDQAFKLSYRYSKPLEEPEEEAIERAMRS